ncbi:MAG: pyrroline-5-carboxylate reductase [Spirochaetota bacterium]
MQTIGIIGCGNMGSAIARGIATSSKLNLDIILFDADSDKAAILASEISAVVADSLHSLQQQSDVTMLAVKPQILPDLYPLLAEEANQQYISIAAGVSIETLSSNLGSSAVCRFMPNVAASVGKAVTAAAFQTDCTTEFKQFCLSVAATFGTVFELPEKLFSAFIGISGSAIAYFYQFLHAVALGGTREGLSYPESVTLASNTFAGAIELLQASGEDPIALQTTVLSAGGTTVHGLYHLEHGFTSEVMDAVSAASKRASDLERSAK